VLGELQTLDREAGLDPFLLVFDRNPKEFEKRFESNISHEVLHRSETLAFYRALTRINRQDRIRLVHAHNLYSAALAISARPRYGYKVVLDLHGRIPEEYVYLGKGGRASRRLLEALERWCVMRSDHVVAVSHKLSDYLASRYRRAQKKISVIPCCVDESLFKWDIERREVVRRSMNLSDKFVCVHLGSFFEWYDPEMISRVFQQIQSRKNAHLLVITGDAEKTRSYLSARLPDSAFTVRSAAHEEVPGLLNASDLGLLLLRSSPNIKTSSPAKFAEYLNSGLPVFITPDVGDFSEMIAREGVGTVVGSAAGMHELSFADRVSAQRAQVAAACVAAGRQLTWQAFSASWSKIVASK
jgi:glycosyltransferase involved in cell wall biosynthesis